MLKLRSVGTKNDQIRESTFDYEDDKQKPSHQ